MLTSVDDAIDLLSQLPRAYSAVEVSHCGGIFLYLV